MKHAEKLGKRKGIEIPIHKITNELWGISNCVLLSIRWKEGKEVGGKRKKNVAHYNVAFVL